jgi:tRNA dimethylallyltransferase
MSVLAIFGPTASGKSAVAEEIARRIPAELVSADSMQAYRGLPILTNQSTFPTHLVAIWPLSHEGSVGEYQQFAHETIDTVLAAGRLPVVVGGTGLYLRAALSGMPIPPEPPPGLRRRLERVYERVGGERAHELLMQRDPAAARHVHPNDRRRVIRALELAELGSSLHPADSRLWTEDTRHPTVIVGLEVPRAELYARIEERTRSMFDQGVEDEVRGALAGPISPTARYVFGLEEIAELPRAKALEALTVRTRQYARYQLKWMRRIPGLVTVRADRPIGDVADDILEVVRARQRLPTRRAS